MSPAMCSWDLSIPDIPSSQLGGCSFNRPGASWDEPEFIQETEATQRGKSCGYQKRMAELLKELEQHRGAGGGELPE